MEGSYSSTVIHLVKKLYPELFDSVPSVQSDIHLILNKVVILLVFEPDLAAGSDEDAPVVSQRVPGQLDHARVGERGNLDLHTHVVFSSWEEIKSF